MLLLKCVVHLKREPPSADFSSLSTSAALGTCRAVSSEVQMASSPSLLCYLNAVVSTSVPTSLFRPRLIVLAAGGGEGTFHSLPLVITHNISGIFTSDSLLPIWPRAPSEGLRDGYRLSPHTLACRYLTDAIGAK